MGTAGPVRRRNAGLLPVPALTGVDFPSRRGKDRRGPRNRSNRRRRTRPRRRARVAANAVLPDQRDGRGSLLFTGGGFALHPDKEYASLSVGKAALRAYVHVLHDQLAGTGVHATIVTDQLEGVAEVARQRVGGDGVGSGLDLATERATSQATHEDQFDSGRKIDRMVP